MSKQPVDFEKYDIRVIQRYLRNGTVDKAAYEAWLNGLPDEAELSAETEAQFSSSREEDQAESADN